MGNQCSTCTTKDQEQEINTQEGQNIINYGLDRRSPAMMKGAEYASSNTSGGGPNGGQQVGGTQSPAMAH